MGRDDCNRQRIVVQQVVADEPKRHKPNTSPSREEYAREGHEVLAHAEVPRSPFYEKERGVTYNNPREDDPSPFPYSSIR